MSTTHLSPASGDTQDLSTGSYPIVRRVRGCAKVTIKREPDAVRAARRASIVALVLSAVALVMTVVALRWPGLRPVTHASQIAAAVAFVVWAIQKYRIGAEQQYRRNRRRIEAIDEQLQSLRPAVVNLASHHYREGYVDGLTRRMPNDPRQLLDGP